MYVAAYPFIPINVTQNIIDYFPLSQYPNRGPVGSGTEWSRTVAIANAALLKCPIYNDANMIAEYASIWKCKFNVFEVTKLDRKMLTSN